MDQGCVLDKVRIYTPSPTPYIGKVQEHEADMYQLEFAHVEFTAVLATILTKHQVVPASTRDVSEEVARKEIIKMIAESSAKMVVNLREPEELCVGLVER